MRGGKNTAPDVTNSLIMKKNLWNNLQNCKHKQNSFASMMHIKP